MASGTESRADCRLLEAEQSPKPWSWGGRKRIIVPVLRGDMRERERKRNRRLGKTHKADSLINI